MGEVDWGSIAMTFGLSFIITLVVLNVIKAFWK